MHNHGRSRIWWDWLFCFLLHNAFVSNSSSGLAEKFESSGMTQSRCALRFLFRWMRGLLAQCSETGVGHFESWATDTMQIYRVRLVHAVDLCAACQKQRFSDCPPSRHCLHSPALNLSATHHTTDLPGREHKTQSIVVLRPQAQLAALDGCSRCSNDSSTWLCIASLLHPPCRLSSRLGTFSASAAVVPPVRKPCSPYLPGSRPVAFTACLNNSSALEYCRWPFFVFHAPVVLTRLANRWSPFVRPASLISLAHNFTRHAAPPCFSMSTMAPFLNWSFFLFCKWNLA